MSSPGAPTTVRTPRRGPRRLRLATVAGVPVLLSPSWLVVAAVITFLFADSASRATGVAPGPGAWAVAFVLAVLLAVSVLLHEAAHAAAARAYGLHVSEIVVDLWGGHTALGRPLTPGASAVVSVVGPLANLVLGAVAETVRRQLFVEASGSTEAVVSFLLLGTAISNVLVGVFNLVPGLPLDGGRVLEALVWKVTGDQDTGAVVAGWAGRVVAVLLVAWVALPPLLSGGLPSTVTLVWTGLVAVFLWRGAHGLARRLAVPPPGRPRGPGLGDPHGPRRPRRGERRRPRHRSGRRGRAGAGRGALAPARRGPGGRRRASGGRRPGR